MLWSAFLFLCVVVVVVVVAAAAAAAYVDCTCLVFDVAKPNADWSVSAVLSFETY